VCYQRRPLRKSIRSPKNGLQKAAATNSSGFFGRGWLDEFGAGDFGLIGFEVGFDFGAEAHAPIAIRIRLCVNYSRLAVCFIGFSASDFGGHADGGLDGHTYLERGRSNKEKPAARDVQGFREMFAFVAGQINGAEAQGNAQAVAFKMSAFRRTHVVFGACSGEGHAPTQVSEA